MNNENQNSPVEQGFEEYLKRKRSKRIRAYIALSLTVALLVIAVVVALFRTLDNGEISEITSDMQSGVIPDVSEEEISDNLSDAESVGAESSEAIEEYFPTINVVTPENVTAAGIYELNSLHCIYSENADQRLSIASITKLITASVAIKYVPLETVITVGSELELVKYDSSVCGLKQGYKLTLEQLLYGLLMSSGNDAAYTVAVNVARYVSKNDGMSDREAVDYFCGLMNELAEEIGAENSSFANPEGWDDENNYSTVSDLIVISKYAIGQDVIAKIVSTVEIAFNTVSGDEMKLRNSNFLLHEQGRFYHPNVTGLKTGSTNNAGKCLVATVNIDGNEYIAVVMGCPDEETRYTSMLSLIRYIEEYNNLKFA